MQQEDNSGKQENFLVALKQDIFKHFSDMIQPSKESIQSEVSKYTIPEQWKELLVKEYKRIQNPTSDTKQQLIGLKVLVTEIQDNDLYVGAERLAQNYQVYPFAQEWNQIQSDNDENAIFCDRCNVVAAILEPGITYKNTNKVAYLKFYGMQSEPKLYSILNIIGIRDPVDNQATVVHVLHTFTEPKQQNPILSIKDSLKSLRQTLLLIAKNDELASEWLLLSLLGTVQFRVSNELGGRIMLNLYNVQNNSGICNQLQQLYVPNLRIDLTLDFLQNTVLQSKKNFDTNILEHGYLQVPSNQHTLVLIDETNLQPGKLNEQGFRNIQYLKKTIEESTQFIDYVYSEVKIESQISSITISEGKSFLPQDVAIPIQPSDKDVEHEVPNENYNQFIEYIQSCSDKIKISLELQSVISNTFVQMRQKIDQVDTKTLHLWIVVTKIYSALEEQQEAEQIQFNQAIQLWERTQLRTTQYLGQFNKK